MQDAIEKLMVTKREAGETAFPDLPTLVDRVDEVKNARLRKVREARERLEAEAEERDRREHPEKYFDVREMIRGFLESRCIRILPPEQKPVISVEGIVSILEIFSAEDLRAFAAIKEQLAFNKQTRGVQ